MFWSAVQSLVGGAIGTLGTTLGRGVLHTAVAFSKLSKLELEHQLVLALSDFIDGFEPTDIELGPPVRIIASRPLSLSQHALSMIEQQTGAQVEVSVQHFELQLSLLLYAELPARDSGSDTPQQPAPSEGAPRADSVASLSINSIVIEAPGLRLVLGGIQVSIRRGRSAPSAASSDSAHLDPASWAMYLQEKMADWVRIMCAGACV